jgi:hypothetical protein
VTGWRTRIALLRLERALRRHGVRRARRREIVGEVHANLHAATADFGEREALRRIGSVRRLAADYIDGDDGGLCPRAGARAAAIALAVLLALTLVRVPTFGSIEVFDRHTGDTTWSWGVWRLWHFGGDVRTDTLFEATVYSYAFILAPALAFALWSRPWRLLRLHARPPHRVTQ